MRIKRYVYENTRHPIYYQLLALQLSKQKPQSWMDILPEDIKNVIWREYFKAPLLQIREFRNVSWNNSNLYAETHTQKLLRRRQVFKGWKTCCFKVRNQYETTLYSE